MTGQVWINVSRWDTYPTRPWVRYVAVSVDAAGRESATISSDAARRLAAAVESLDPESAARLRQVADEVSQCAGPGYDLGDEVEEVEDSPEAIARAYRIFEVAPPASG
jgi:hypothetical protein